MLFFAMGDSPALMDHSAVEQGAVRLSGRSSRVRQSYEALWRILKCISGGDRAVARARAHKMLLCQSRAAKPGGIVEIDL